MKAARFVASMFWGLVLFAHGAAAVAAWLLLPGGFPFGHARLLANRVLPAFVVVSVLTVMIQALRRSQSTPILLLVYPCAWLGVALATIVSFPHSGTRPALAALAFALLFALGLIELLPRASHRRAAWLLGPFAAGLGAAFVLAQRAPEPSTRPAANTSAQELSADQLLPQIDLPEPVVLAPWLHVESKPERVTAKLRRVEITVEPRLTFSSRSPDGFWTLFSNARPLPSAFVVRGERTAQTLHWQDSQGGSLRVEIKRLGVAMIEAHTRLEEPVYSHLNSFAGVSITGHRRLGLRFSACPAEVVEVTHSEYPFGAPARLAYRDAYGTFRVVQASSAEKGPFTTLAQGPLARGEPLRVQLVELAEPSPRELVTIVFHDWSLQLSTELSPTAGWGLPQNALEFGLIASEPSSDAYLDLTLAGTSVGRGWDSVGHLAGTYVNRVELRAPPE